VFAVIRHPNDLNLALIIGLAALGLLLLLIVLASLIAVIATRCRRRPKGTEAGEMNAAWSNSTVSVNLSPSESSCSRTSDRSADSDGEVPAQSADDDVDAPAPPLPPSPPPLPPVLPHPGPDALTTPHDQVVLRPQKEGSGAGTDRSWTQSLPAVAGVLTHDPRKAPPIVAKKKAAKLSAVGRPHTFSAPADTDPAGVSVTSTSADPLPGLGPERPADRGPTGRYVHVKPKLHREPRGWAPASHAVPAPVKRTWGRAKAKLAAESGKEADPSVILSNTSLADDDDNIGSVLTLA